VKTIGFSSGNMDSAIDLFSGCRLVALALALGWVSIDIDCTETWL